VIGEGCEVAPLIRTPTLMFSLDPVVFAIAMLVTAPFKLSNGTRIRLEAGAAGVVPS
jgi:hypothetical protein